LEYRERIDELSPRLKLDPLVIERVLRITDVLGLIAENDGLSMLAFKGGSALHYVYMGGMPRLSVDLDFNALGGKEEVFKVRDTLIKPEIVSMGKSHDYEVKDTHRYEGSVYRLYYTNSIGTKDYLKIEISFIDRIPVLPIEEGEFAFPFSKEKVRINVLALDELLAEKLRALYTRTKGRDLLDAYYAADLEIDKDRLRKLLIYKLTKARVAFNPSLYFQRVSAYDRRNYETNLRGLVAPDSMVPFEEARERFLDFYSFLGDLDERDRLFIELFRDLFGENISKKTKAEISSTPELVERPLAYLFGKTEITDMASDASLEDIRVFKS